MRFFATRLNGDGTENLVADELPLRDVKISRAISGAGGIQATISPDHPQLTGRVLAPRRTAVYAETDHGVILGGGIITPDTDRTGSNLNLECQGHAGFLMGMPYDGNQKWIGVDPAHLIRHAWAHVQSRLYHNLGVVVDSTTTPVRIGTEEREVEFTTSSGEEVSFESGPVKWNYWSTHDLGKEIDNLAQSTPIDYAMSHVRIDSETIEHRLLLGYPRLGRRRTDLRFEVGVNVLEEPTVRPYDDVSDVLVIGAGEGSSAKRGRAHRNTGALGGTVAIQDKSLTTNDQCARRAQQILDMLSGKHSLQSFTVHGHPNAPIGSWQVGDDVRVVSAGEGWVDDLDIWVRVVSDEVDPINNTATLHVAALGEG